MKTTDLFKINGLTEERIVKENKLDKVSFDRIKGLSEIDFGTIKKLLAYVQKFENKFYSIENKLYFGDRLLKEFDEDYTYENMYDEIKEELECYHDEVLDITIQDYSGGALIYADVVTVVRWNNQILTAYTKEYEVCRYRDLPGIDPHNFSDYEQEILELISDKLNVDDLFI